MFKINDILKLDNWYISPYGLPWNEEYVVAFLYLNFPKFFLNDKGKIVVNQNDTEIEETEKILKSDTRFLIDVKQASDIYPFPLFKGIKKQDIKKFVIQTLKNWEATFTKDDMPDLGILK